MTQRKKYVQIGLGGRSAMYFYAVLSEYAETSEMVGISDINQGRMQLAVDRARAQGVK